MAFRSGLSWPEARVLLEQGSYVRRDRWTDKRLFRTAGALVWVDATPPRVVRDADFGRAEFLALDWTNMGFDQGDCIPHPGWTQLLINETARWTTATPATRVPNPPSWAPLYVGGREVSFGTMHAWAGGHVAPPRTTESYWEHPFLMVPAVPAALDWYGRPVLGALYELVTWTVTPASPGSGDILLSRTIPNPFAAACAVAITGTATDALLLNGVEVPLPASFALASSASFTLAVRLRNPTVQAVASLNLEVDLTLEP